MDLVRRVQGKKIFRFTQLKNITHILSSGEKKIFGVSFAIFIVAAFWSLGVLAGNFRVEVPTVGGTYTEAIVGGPQLVNPIFALINDVDVDLAELVYSGLMRVDNSQRLVADLAESYEISEDGKTYTFTLREGALWHDGEPVTANDILFTIETIQNPAINSPLLVSFKGVGVEKLDDRRVVFTLSEAFPAFLSSLTVGVLPEHIWQDIGPDQFRLTQKNLRPIGSGPFKFDQLLKDESGFILQYDLVRNPEYYEAAPYLERLEFRFYADYGGVGGAIQDLRESKVDSLHFVPYDLRDRVERKHIALKTLQLPQYTALMYNQKTQPLLEKSELRDALAMALDKDRIVREGLQNEGQVIYSPILPGFPGYKEDIEKTPYDIAAANAALDELFERLPASEYRDKLRKAYIEEWKAAQVVEVVADDTTTSTPETAAEESSEPSAEPTPAETTTDTEQTDENTPAASEEVTTDIPEDIIAAIESRLDNEIHPAQTFYRVDEDENIIQLSLVTSDTTEYTHSAELIAGFWQEIGIKTNLSYINPKEFSREVLKGRAYDVLLYGLIVGEDPDQYPFWHSSQISHPGLNLAQYVNRKADELLEKARETTSEEERITYYTEFQDILLEDNPATFLYMPTYTYAVSTQLYGFDVSSIAHPSDRFSNITQWYLKTKGQWKFKK